MKANTIRVRLRKTKQVVECYAQDLDEYGNLNMDVKKVINGKEYSATERIRPSEFEILPEQDFYDFRNQTAREVMLKLIGMKIYGIDGDADKLVAKAIELTDKLISKL